MYSTADCFGKKGKENMSKNRKGGFFGIALAVFFTLAFVGIIVGILAGEVNSMQAAEYHTSMSALSDPASIPVSGDKIVTYLDNKLVHDTKPMFSTEYVPEGCQTDIPEEVRYILYCEKHGEFAGTYSNNGGVGEIILVDIQIFDRVSGQAIATREFRGGNPPYQVKSGGVHYGSEPDKAAIESWILSSIRNSTTADVPAAEVAEVTVYAQVPDGWNGPGCWVWSSEGVDAFDAWPGEPMTLQDDWYAITVPAWIDYVIINANNGTTQTSDLPVEAGRDVWVIVNEYSEAQVFYENPRN